MWFLWICRIYIFIYVTTTGTGTFQGVHLGLKGLGHEIEFNYFDKNG